MLHTDILFFFFPLRVTPGFTHPQFQARNRDTEAEVFRPVSEKHYVSSSVFTEVRSVSHLTTRKLFTCIFLACLHIWYVSIACRTHWQVETVDRNQEQVKAPWSSEEGEGADEKLDEGGLSGDHLKKSEGATTAIKRSTLRSGDSLRITVFLVVLSSSCGASSSPATWRVTPKMRQTQIRLHLYCSELYFTKLQTLVLCFFAFQFASELGTGRRLSFDS